MALAYPSIIYQAAPGDGNAIRQIAAATGVFNAEEVQCVADIWEEYLRLGVEASGYTFFVEREGEQALGFACVGPRALADRVYDLYWIAVDPRAGRRGGRRRPMRLASPSGRMPSRASVPFTSVTRRSILNSPRPGMVSSIMGVLYNMASP